MKCRGLQICESAPEYEYITPTSKPTKILTHFIGENIDEKQFGKKNYEPQTLLPPPQNGIKNEPAINLENVVKKYDKLDLGSIL